MAMESSRYARKIPLTESERKHLEQSARVASPRKKNKLPPLIALIVAVVVVMAAVWYMYLRPSDDNSPESTVRNMVDAMNRRDGRDFVSHTTLILESPALVEGEISDLEQNWAEDNNPQLKIVSLEVTEKG